MYISVPAKEFLKEAETYDYVQKALCEYALDNNYISDDDPVNIFYSDLGLDSSIVKEWKQQQTYDIILFSRRSGQIKCNEDIKLKEAKKICDSNNSKGANYFAGYAVHGSFTNCKQGDDFLIDGDEVINPKL